MLFNSVDFLIFFPIVVLAYFIIPHKIRWIWLLIGSYYFYMCWNPTYALLMATSTGITYLSGLLITNSNKIELDKKRIFYKKMWVTLSLVSNLSILFFFKYFDFAVSNILNLANSLFRIDIAPPTFDVLLPVGISFYTFQALSYTIDVYRGDIEAEKNIGKYALFVSFFPQLVAGPIERSKNLLNQIHERHYFDYNRVKYGLQLMLWGFFQKLVIADISAHLVNQVYNNYNDYSGIQLVIATALFAVQIYCDFAGYSNIAIGAAQVMGFNLMKNFDHPYFATSIKDFWRRWHISLSTWFKDYLYIPLGGNRCSRIKKYSNLMITFLVSGLWHGASWNYVIWGGLHGIYQVMGDLTRPIRQKTLRKLKVRNEVFSYKLFQMILTFIIVDFTWIFFRAPSATVAIKIISRMFTNFDILSLFNNGLLNMGLSKTSIILLCIAITILIAVSLIQTKVNIRRWLSRQNCWFRWIIYFIGLAVVFASFIAQNGGYGDTVQFIYFQF